LTLKQRRNKSSAIAEMAE